MNEMALLSITEKQTTHKPGGCVGIFFQLFDWNRRLAKKKLFSRKLLPPGGCQCDNVLWVYKV